MTVTNPINRHPGRGDWLKKTCIDWVYKECTSQDDPMVVYDDGSLYMALWSDLRHVLVYRNDSLFGKAHIGGLVD